MCFVFVVGFWEEVGQPVVAHVLSVTVLMFSKLLKQNFKIGLVIVIIYYMLVHIYFFH